jgi:hypothetical protein
MVQESNGSSEYAPFGVAAIAVDSYLPLKVNETSDFYPLRSMKRAIVEGPRRKIAGLRQAPQSVVVMDVNGAIFPRQVRMLSLALVADDLALQGSFEVALDLTIWPIRHRRFDEISRKMHIHRVNIVAAPETVLCWVKFNQERRDAFRQRQSCCTGQFYI